MKYDLTNVAAAFLNHDYPEEVRGQLVRDCSAAINQPTKPVQLLIAQVAHECLERPFCTPEITIKIGVMYGLALGILCEQDRREREERRKV